MPRCSNCHNIVPLFTRAGSVCPHCGARFKASLVGKITLVILGLSAITAAVALIIMLPQRKSEAAQGDYGYHVYRMLQIMGNTDPARPGDTKRILADFVAENLQKLKQSVELSKTLTPGDDPKDKEFQERRKLLAEKLTAFFDKNSLSDLGPDAREIIKAFSQGGAR